MPTILCIDDDERALSIRIKILEHMHYRVLAANSAVEGLEIVSRERVDVILLDYFMPGMTGAEVAWELRRRGSDIPVLMLSSMVFCPHEARDLVDAFCAKIDGPNQLLHTIAQLVKVADERRARVSGHGRQGSGRRAFASRPIRRTGLQVMKSGTAGEGIRRAQLPS